MADGFFPTLVSRTENANAANNVLFTQLSDGTAALSTTTGSLHVNVTNASIVVTATNLDIRDLTHVSDSVKVGDGTDFLAIAADGSIAVTDNGGSLTVDGTVAISSIIPGTAATNLGKAEDAAHTSGDVGVMSLAVRNDAGTVLAGTDLDYIPLTTDATGALRTVTSVTIPSNKAEDAAHTSGDTGDYVLAVRQDTLATSTSADGDYASFKTNAAGALYVSVSNASIVVTATDLDIRDLTHVSDSVKVGDGTDFLAIAADGSIAVTDNGASLTVDAVNLDIRDLTLAQDAVQVSANSTVNSATNPIFVQAVTTGVITGETHNYSTATVAGGGTSNHDYTVTNTFKLMQVICSASGAAKFEVQTGPVASLVTVETIFLPKEGGTQPVTFAVPREVPNTSTGTVRIIRTNREGSSQDLYSTIVGIDN